MPLHIQEQKDILAKLVNFIKPTNLKRGVKNEKKELKEEIKQHFSFSFLSLFTILIFYCYIIYIFRFLYVSLKKNIIM